MSAAALTMEEARTAGDAAAAPRLASLRRNFSWTLAGNLVYTACQWGMLVVLAKLMSPEAVGQYALGLAVTAPVMLFSNLHLRTIYATGEGREHSFRDFLSLRLVASLAALAVIAALSVGLGYGLEATLVVLAVGGMKFVEVQSDVIFGMLQTHERMDRIARSVTVKGVLSLAVFGGALLSGLSLLTALLLVAAAWLAVLVVVDVAGNRDLAALEGADWYRPRLSLRAFRGLWPLVVRSLPLGVVAMLISLTPNVPRYSIEHYHGSHELGLFSGLVYVMVAGQTLVNAAGQVVLPRLGRLREAGDWAGFRALTGRTVLLGAGLGLVGVVGALLFGEPFLRLVYAPAYAERADVLVWLAAASGIGFVASFLWYSVTALGVYRPQVPLFVGVVAASVGACALFVPAYGSTGAAAAMVVGMTVQLVGTLFILRRALGAAVRTVVA